ncbi:MAG: hypothetical protein IKZ62_03835 [Prevotella sp.]|nr:hypothetical protein [Prevotella sp.]
MAHYLKLKYSFVFQMLLYISLFFTAVEIIEQFTYPNYLFCGRIEKEDNTTVEQRMGIWRMYVYGIYCCMLCFTLLLQKILDGKNLMENVAFIIVVFVGIVFFVARKNIYAAVSVVALGFLFGKGKSSFLPKLFLAALLIALFYILPNIMIDLNEKSANELGNDDFIRFIAARHFIYDFNGSPLYYLFGAGIPYGESALSAKISQLSEYYKIYQSDCGFIGYFSKVGIIGLLPYILIFYKIIKNYKFVDLSLLLYLVILIELAFFDFFGQQLRNVVPTMLYLYLVEQSIRKNKLKNGRCLNETDLRKAVLRMQGLRASLSKESNRL